MIIIMRGGIFVFSAAGIWFGSLMFFGFLGLQMTLTDQLLLLIADILMINFIKIEKK